MKLSWRDAAAAVPVAGTAGLYLAHLADIEVAVLSGARVVALVAFVLGVTACAVGGGIDPAEVPQPREPWLRALGLHGPVAFILTVIALITGNWGVVAALVVLIVLMWLTTTLHRLLTPKGLNRAGPTALPGHRPPACDERERKGGVEDDSATAPPVR